MHQQGFAKRRRGPGASQGPGTCMALTDEEDIELALLDLLLYVMIYNHMSSHAIDS